MNAPSPFRRTRRKRRKEQLTESSVKHVVPLRHYAPQAREVFVAGTFNDWNTRTHPMRRGEDGVWETFVELDSGHHEYKFVVDGQWIHDDLNPEFVINPFGTRNSIFPDA